MIEEIPIDVSEEAPPEPDAIDEPLSTIEEETAPKKRGRPPGSKNLAKLKVVTTKTSKKKAPPPPPSEYEDSEEEYEPPPQIRRTHSRASAPEYEEDEVVSARSVATEMLQMLSQRNTNRIQAKRQKYASWFPNNGGY